MNRPDIIVVGAGIAGLSAAAELAAEASVSVFEMEPLIGYHASGRSAAYFAAAYGPRTVRDLTGCCEAFLVDPPEGFCEAPLLHPRDSMFFAREDQAPRLEAMLADNSRLEFLDAEAVRERVPVFAEGYLYGAAWERRGGDLDVNALLTGYRRRLIRRGGALHTDCRVTGLTRSGSGWQVETSTGVFEAGVVVNAAGAWAEQLGTFARLGPLGLRPLRRTALTVDPPAGIDVRDWPEMLDVDEAFYFKPDAGRILISPADETPTAPCDAQAEAADVALGVQRFEQATGMDIQRVCAHWAGLRTFAPDRLPVVGFDPRTEGYFWLAGQGGFGVQSAPALARLATLLITGATPGGDVETVRQYIGALAPERLL